MTLAEAGERGAQLAWLEQARMSLAGGRVAEGVDALRAGLWQVPEQVATGAPVLVAQALHELGRGFMTLGRLAEAEEVLPCSASAQRGSA